MDSRPKCPSCHEKTYVVKAPDQDAHEWLCTECELYFNSQ